MPFADDVRKYTFPSLFKLVNKAGKEVTEHPFLPTEKQMEFMEKFVDAMDLMDCGAKDEEGYVHFNYFLLCITHKCAGTVNLGMTPLRRITRPCIA